MNDQRCTCHTRIPCDKCIEWAHSYMKKKDIVAELRDWANTINQTPAQVHITMLHAQIFTQAADEIERLRTLQTPPNTP